MDGAVISMPDNYTKTAKWNITCHYDKEKEPTDFMECMALFMLEKEQGWDASFRPIIENSNTLKKGGV